MENGETGTISGNFRAIANKLLLAFKTALNRWNWQACFFLVFTDSQFVVRVLRDSESANVCPIVKLAKSSVSICRKHREAGLHLPSSECSRNWCNPILWGMNVKDVRIVSTPRGEIETFHAGCGRLKTHRLSGAFAN